MALNSEDKADVARHMGKKMASKVSNVTNDAKTRALSNKSKKYTFHDIRSGQEREADYSEVRSGIKKAYSGSRVSRKVREMAQDLKPRTSEGIPANGGYYHRVK